ncbi:hypothetical protein KO566_09470 [Flavobacteriaceae bacterium XHP0103]|uniref:MATE family efflux transporter n=1 Tax=Marixanthotalea marina TaxID=2844359 RepID=UPI002989CBEE|nr:MATE family efflux transporter [Marixanthotalea marina]MBU3822289.1 hypothetical protein [Marixanthotalea marina]
MSSNKVIAKNTLFLYFRTFFKLGIGLYTSRIVLEALGVVDYGIYSIVGGVVGILSFMHAALSGTTTRFLNISKVGDLKRLKTVFNTSIILHFCLAIVVFIIAETLGLWFFYNKLVIPESRMDIAFWVYQVSVVSILFMIMQIPYDASIIAHEKMGIYTYLSILEAILKLAVAIVISYISLDKLLWYAILILVLSIGIRLTYQVYCRRNFEECKFNFLFDRVVIKEMFSFFSWDLYGNLSVMLRLQGVNILLNMFFGPVVNASVAIVSQFQGGLMSLSSNFALAAKPQVIQSYAGKDYERLFFLLKQGTKFSFYLMMLISIPLSFNSDFILELWLHEVPLYADQFLQLSLLASVVSVSFLLFIPLIHATGKMFLISFLTGSIYLLSLPINYVFFKYNFGPIAPYYISFFVFLFAGLANLFIVQKYVPAFNAMVFVKAVLIKMYAIYLVLIGLGFLQQIYLPMHAILSILVLFILSSGLVLAFGITKKEKYIVFNVLKKKIKK